MAAPSVTEKNMFYEFDTLTKTEWFQGSTLTASCRLRRSTKTWFCSWTWRSPATYPSSLLLWPRASRQSRNPEPLSLFPACRVAFSTTNRRCDSGTWRDQNDSRMTTPTSTVLKTLIFRRKEAASSSAIAISCDPPSFARARVSASSTTSSPSARTSSCRPRIGSAECLCSWSKCFKTVFFFVVTDVSDK